MSHWKQRNNDGHEHGGRFRGTLQRKTGGEGCQGGDRRGRLHPPATSPLGQGAEHTGGDGEEQRRIELKKFSLRPKKYDGKGDFEGWVNQFEEYATLGQWNEEEKASLLFLSLTAGARMYFVGLPEREKMAYATRVEALRRRFGQEKQCSAGVGRT